MNYYPHHLGDYAKDTGHLSLLEHGAYRLLLDHYYSTEKPLPSAAGALQRICRAVTKHEREAVASVAAQFFIEAEGLLRHARVDREIKNYSDRAEAAASAGKASGAARRAKAERNTNGTRTGVERTLNGRSISVGLSVEPSNNQEPKVLLEKEPKGAEAPLLLPVVEPQSRRIPDEEPAKPGSRPTGRAALRAEAEATNLLPIPPDLNSLEFRAVWGEWCQHRARLAGQGKPWSAIAARNLLRQCCDNGEAWAIAEIRQALASGWQGVQWDQRRNPSDVRSQPLKPNGNNPQGTPRPAPIVTRNTAPLPAGRQSLNALAWKPAPRVQDDERSGA